MDVGESSAMPTLPHADQASLCMKFKVQDPALVWFKNTVLGR
jgi:hypothetical protein